MPPRGSQNRGIKWTKLANIFGILSCFSLYRSKKDCEYLGQICEIKTTVGYRVPNLIMTPNTSSMKIWANRVPKHGKIIEREKRHQGEQHKQAAGHAHSFKPGKPKDCAVRSPRRGLVKAPKPRYRSREAHTFPSSTSPIPHITPPISMSVGRGSRTSSHFVGPDLPGPDDERYRCRLAESPL